MPLSHSIHYEKTVIAKDKTNVIVKILIVIIIIANRGEVGRDENIIMKID